MRFPIALAFVLVSACAFAQTPQTQPLLQSEHLTYLGSFTLPDTDGQPPSGESNKFRYSVGALGVGPDGQSLYFGCHELGNKLARVAIPAIGGVAKVVTPCTTIPNLQAIDPNASESKRLGGSLAWNGRTIVSAYTYYDGSENATASHFAGASDLTGMTGPVRVAAFNKSPGWTGGPMGTIPTEWRPLLGAPAGTSLCCVSVITRSSFGPDFVAFNPDDLGAVTPPVPGTLLLGYDAAHPLGPFSAQNPLFHGATKMAGFAFVGGTRSLLFFGRHGDNYCYGLGSACNDPQITSQGNHSYPYRHQVWAYDANDLVLVKQGSKQPWEVQPYAVWTITAVSPPGFADMRAVAYDDVAKRLYMIAWAGGDVPRVHVFAVTVPAADVPCDGYWSDWARVDPPAGLPLECLATPEGWRESWTEEMAWTTTQQPQGAGAACPASPVLETRTQACTPPPVDYTCTVQSAILVAGVQVLQSTCGAVIDNATIPVGMTWTVRVPRP